MISNRQGSNMQRKTASAGAEDSKKKERHIVSWSQEEDDILREQIRIHGTDNWTIIASKFKDKTTRQCRRRWYTYLNSDFKKGGWSPEEDMLLCEAQKIFGNRWTEIAKVVSGRTDNAVKNRFSTLCKKRAKYEALAKENSASYINQNNKRVIIHDTLNVDVTESATLAKKMRRAHLGDGSEGCNFESRSLRQPGITPNWQQLRTPFTVLVQNIHNNLSMRQQGISKHMKITEDALSDRIFLRKDDPKVTALMQQAELLSSLVFQVNAESTDQSFENAWKLLQDYLNPKKEGDVSSYKISNAYFQQDFKEMVEDFVKSDMESQESWRQPYLQDDSPSSSEYSTGSAVLPCTPPNHQNGKTRVGEDRKNEYVAAEVSSHHSKEGSGTNECGIFASAVTEIMESSDAPLSVDDLLSASQQSEFRSPIQVTPLFRTVGAGIPSPKFSESERSFLMRTLGMESPMLSTLSIDPSNPPPCKRALLHSL